MIEFGETLRKAREAKGLTISQLASTTHLAPSTIEELENENFERIAAPIYGRGFVKLYCEETGLDTKAMVAEFMAIYNGNRDPIIHERSVKVEAEPHDEPPPEPPTTPQPEPTATTVTETQSSLWPLEDGLFSRPQDEAPQANTPKAAPPTPKPEPPVEAPHSPASFPRYSTPMSERPRPVRIALPTIPWRLILLAVVAVALVVVLACGIRTLYRATSGSTPATTAPTAEPVKPKAAKAPAETKTLAKAQPQASAKTHRKAQ